VVVKFNGVSFVWIYACTETRLFRHIFLMSYEEVLQINLIFIEFIKSVEVIMTMKKICIKVNGTNRKGYYVLCD
jgi:hypothetical protein